MGLLKIFASLFLIGSPLQTPDADGWVAVERQEKPAEDFEEEKGVWVVVSKKLGSEHFFIRFPEDPSTHSVKGGLSWTAPFNGDVLTLRTEQRDEGKEAIHFFEERLLSLNSHPETFLIKTQINAGESDFDLFYRQEGKWVWEKIIATPHFFYLFQTTSDQMSGDSHRQFIASFSHS